jgi:8-oxo-dGTP diphosphatase
MNGETESPRHPRARGCSILLVDRRRRVLLYRRDDRPDLPEPNKWDLIGGQVEPGETPEQAIVREVKEELALVLTGHQLFRQTEFPDRTEHTFWAELPVPAENLVLYEGQELRLFTEAGIAGLDLAFGFGLVLQEFYRQWPVP